MLNISGVQAAPISLASQSGQDLLPRASACLNTRSSLQHPSLRPHPSPPQLRYKVNCKELLCRRTMSWNWRQSCISSSMEERISSEGVKREIDVDILICFIQTFRSPVSTAVWRQPEYLLLRMAAEHLLGNRATNWCWSTSPGGRRVTDNNRNQIVVKKDNLIQFCSQRHAEKMSTNSFAKTESWHIVLFFFFFFRLRSSEARVCESRLSN